MTNILLLPCLLRHALSHVRIVERVRLRVVCHVWRNTFATGTPGCHESDIQQAKDYAKLLKRGLTCTLSASKRFAMYSPEHRNGLDMVLVDMKADPPAILRTEREEYCYSKLQTLLSPVYGREYAIWATGFQYHAHLWLYDLVDRRLIDCDDPLGFHGAFPSGRLAYGSLALSPSGTKLAIVRYYDIETVSELTIMDFTLPDQQPWPTLVVDLPDEEDGANFDMCTLRNWVDDDILHVESSRISISGPCEQVHLDTRTQTWFKCNC